MTRLRLPRIDTQEGIRFKDTADFSFVFSSEIRDWQRKKTMTNKARLEAKKKRENKPDTMRNTGWGKST